MKVHLRVDQKANRLVRYIEDMHQGAIGKITMCREEFAESDIIDPDKTLIENGITSDDPVTIIYDYKPLSEPLLDLNF